MVQVLWTRYFWQLWVCSSLQQQSTKITKVQYYYCKWRQLSTTKCTSKSTFGAYHLSLWQNKKIKMTANDHDSCNITVVFAWMGATCILVVRIGCKIAVGCHTMLIESCANHSTRMEDWWKIDWGCWVSDIYSMSVTSDCQIPPFCIPSKSSCYITHLSCRSEGWMFTQGWWLSRWHHWEGNLERVASTQYASIRQFISRIMDWFIVWAPESHSGIQ